MYRNLIVFCVLLLSVAGCVKKDNRPDREAVTTTVSGRVLSRYTRTPMAGVTLSLSGNKRYESDGICLFCPDSESFVIATTKTDDNGYYTLTGTTEEPVTSTLIRASSGSYAQFVPKGTASAGIDFTGVQYIHLKETFHVVNNTEPPLGISVPITSAGGWIHARDTTFVVYGASLDTGITVYNSYRYMRNGQERSKPEGFQIGGYADTLSFTFTVDPTTF